MKTHFMRFAAALGIAGALIGYAAAQSETKLPTAVPPTNSSIKEKLTDGSFVEKAALNSMTETELSKLALQKSQNKKVKKFAQKIADGATVTMTKLKEVASPYRLEVPQQLSADQRAMITQMQQLSAQEFDQAYADVMKKTQDTAVSLYDNAAGQGTLNAELRVFAHQQLPRLRQNQKIAHTLSPASPSSVAIPKNKITSS